MTPTTIRRARRALAALIVGAALGCAACNPPLPGSITPPADGDPLSCAQDPQPTAAQRLDAGRTVCNVALTAPDADGVLAVIDSITWQAALAPMGGGPELTRPVYGAPGWTLAHALPYLRMLDAAEVDLVVATGTNEGNPALTGGWDARDEAALAEVQAMGFRSIAYVQPALGPGAERFPGHRAQLDIVRARYAATGWPVVDWLPAANTPGILGADQLHLATGPDEVTPTYAAAAARGSVIEAAATAAIAAER